MLASTDDLLSLKYIKLQDAGAMRWPRSTVLSCRMYGQQYFIVAGNMLPSNARIITWTLFPVSSVIRKARMINVNSF